MTTSDSTELGTLTWIVMGTSLGSLITKVDWSRPRHSNDQTIPVYDTCWVTMRPEVWYQPEGLDELRFTEAEARDMGYVYIHWTGATKSDSTRNALELIEIEGDMITDYIPINPHPEILKTRIDMTVSQILYTYKAKNSEELDIYVNQLMGRINPKAIT